MIEAYAVSVRIGLKNAWSAGLFALNRGLIGAGRNAEELQLRLNRIKLTMMAGGLMVGAGALGLYAVEKTLKPAEEYAAAINRMRLAGMSNVEVAQSIGAAWKNTGTVITTTATENISALLDLRSVLGTTSYAIKELPFITKVGTVLASATEGRAGTPASIAFTMAKALDIIGAARDPKRFESEGTQMERVITAFQGRVSPRQYQSVFQYARQSKFDLSNDFKYQVGLPSLMLEMSGSNGSSGGGSRGVGPMMAAFYRVTNQGLINKKALALWEELGLVPKGKSLKTQTTGTVMDPVVNRQLAASNPFTWAQDLDQRIKKKFGNDIGLDKEREIIGQMFRGNQLAAQMMMEFISKPQNSIRDGRLIQQSTSGEKAYNQALNNPVLVYHALQAQLTNAEIQLGIVALPAVIKAVKWLTSLLVDLNGEMQKNPAMVKAIVVGFVALSAALVFGGSLLLIVGGFAALATVLGSAGIAAGIFGVVIGITALGAALLLFGPQIKKALTNLPGEFMSFMKAQIAQTKTGLHGLYDVFIGINLFNAAQTKKGLGEMKASVLELLNILKWVSNPATAVGDYIGAHVGAWLNPSAVPKLAQAIKIPAAPKPLSKADTSQAFKDALHGENLPAAIAIAVRGAVAGLTVKLDGKTVGQIVMGQIGKESARPPTGPSGFDTRMTPAYSGKW